MMPRYLVERTFPGGLAAPANAAGARAWLQVVDQNAIAGVTWLHSYVTDDLVTMVCIYESPNAAAIRHAADRNGLPVDRITEVTVLEPYVYTGEPK